MSAGSLCSPFLSPDKPSPCNMPGTLDTGGRETVRRLRKGPLGIAMATPVLFAIFGAALVGGSGLDWYAGLAKPWFLVPLWAFYLVGLAYYVLAAVVLYRVLVHIDDPGGRAASFALTVGLLLLNELWNYGFFGLRSTLAGFLGIAVFLVVLTALMAALRRYERLSAGLLVPYYLWVLYDLAWTYELWRLNGAG
jgi:benzodiazapine receptor